MLESDTPAMDRRVPLTLLALLALIAVQSFFPLLHVGLITNDDLKLGNAALDRGARGVAAWYLPFAVDSFVYFKAVSLAAIVADLVLFALFARSVFGCGEPFFLVLLLSLVGLQNSWEHSPLTAFPGLFTFTFAYLLGSFLAFQRFLARGGWRWLALSTTLFVLALCSYEMYILYTPVLFGLALLAGRTRRQALRAMAPHLVGVVLYVVAYLTSHLLRSGDYAGVTIAPGLDLLGAARVLWQFSISSLPGYFFFSQKYDFLLRSHSRLPGLPGLIETVSAGSLIKAALVGGVFAFLMARAHRASSSPQSSRRLAAITAAGLLYFFVPSALPALTEKYREEVKTQLGAQFSYFSLFAWVFAAAGLLLLASRGRPRAFWRRTTTIVTGLGLVAASLVVDFTNAAVGEWQAVSRDRFLILEELIATPDYAAIPEGSFLYAPSLWKPDGTIIFVGAAIDPRPSLDPRYENFWTLYFNLRGRKRVIVTDRLERIPPGQGFFYLNLVQLEPARTRYVVFGWVDRAGPSGTTLASDHLTVYDRSASTSARVGGAIVDRGTPTVVTLAGGGGQETTDRFLFDVGTRCLELGRLRRCAIVAAASSLDAESVFLAATESRQMIVRKRSGWFLDGWIGAEARATLFPDDDSRVIVDGYAPDYVFRSLGIRKITVTLELDGTAVATRDVTREGRFRVEAEVDRGPARDLVIRCGPLHKPPGPEDERDLCVVVNGVTLRKREPAE
jgi:hypothetical protein